jgi:hypothetical protein
MVSLTRKVRSAGRTSGSIEITLPPEMQALEGIECRLILRDGARPEIVIQPDISIASAVFAEQWDKLRMAFRQIGDIGAFRLADFDVSFLPPRHWSEKPPLSYRDALALHHAKHTAVEIDPSGLSYVITFLTVGAAYRLGLQDRYALVFGVLVGYLVSGLCAGNGTDFEEDVAFQLLAEHQDKAQPPLGALFKTTRWEDAQEGFARIFSQVRVWQENPHLYEEHRRRWSGNVTVQSRVDSLWEDSTL